MSETIRSNSDSNSASARRAKQSWGLAAAGLLFTVAVGLVAWVEMSTWRQMERLREDLGAANLESFFLGAHLREGVLRMNGALFRFQLSEDEAERESFYRDAKTLSGRMVHTKSLLTTDAERQLLEEIEKTFAVYRRDMEAYLDRGIRGIRKDTASILNRQLSEQSQPLVGLADKLVQAQQTALNRFLGSSQAALVSMQRLLALSVLLLIVFVGSVAALLHRIKVAPLQARLSASEEIIERQEKLASLGVLAAGVAHEVRNPLTAIKFRLFSLKKSLPDSLADHEDLNVVHGEINRLERIVKDFLQFARPSEPELADMPVAGLLQDVKDLLGPELDKRSIHLTVEPFDSVMIHADRQQLQQVLINLVQNAADSIAHRGSITLRARQGASSALNQSQPMVTIEVIDTGKGMSHAVEKRLFDPFFSTKEGGTGLGLPIAARIVEKHGGFIQYLTQPNLGTTFSIVLPKIPSNESAPASN
jgi:signal transduction histidine kinase